MDITDIIHHNRLSDLIQWTLSPFSSHLCIVFASPVQSGFLPPKQATMNHNQSRTDPDIVGTEPDHLGPVFCSPWN